ncbi:PREDICTED: membrane-spanning 4-domains subfamily A member 3 isoform X2 [Colobus angolensis palliatus]|uniref:membrane-spanning 4-domains subfamily A member 3 isoform X2 n=1 Tax=Colobus angolensis palliatus TaxID=336983 RepID=UPI0005F4C169|nr:PREDICTED: membrane-spanning 4-domains subfamily A member 3 isoform X2 [Colobus angolensis palliatus]
MASHEVDNAELGSASARGTPGREAGPDELNNSVYQPIDGSQDYQKGKLQVLGAIQILNAAMILALGVFLGSLQYLFYLQRHFFFFTFHTGYPFWGAVFFCSSGTLSVVAGRKPARIWIQNSFGMNFASATIALVGIAFLSINLAVNILSLKSCQSTESPDLCNYMGSVSNVWHGVSTADSHLAGIVHNHLYHSHVVECKLLYFKRGNFLTSQFCGIKNTSL